jgi:hypothetical protein
MKTRMAYGKHSNGTIYNLGDTVNQALQAGMTVHDFEKQLVKINPQLKITFKVEPR